MRPALEHHPLEAGEQRVELVSPAREQRVHVAALRHARPLQRAFRERVAIDHRDPLEKIAQHAGRAEARHAAANHNRVLVSHQSRAFPGEPEVFFADAAWPR